MGTSQVAAELPRREAVWEWEEMHGLGAKGEAGSGMG